MHVLSDTAAARLRRLLARLEPPDCDCPPLLDCPCGQECPPGARETCRHCLDLCDCHPLFPQPPCRHVTAEPDPADLFALAREYSRLRPGGAAADVGGMVAELLRLACPGEYGEPGADLPEWGAVGRESRVCVMEARHAAGMHVECAGDRWRRRVSSLGVGAGRLRNGAVVETGVRRG